MALWNEETVRVGGVDVTAIKGGSGEPVLVLHDELGYPGWMTWNQRLAEQRTLFVPLQPGFGRTPRVEWLRNYRDLAGLYVRMLHELRLEPIDVIGFSAGAFVAAEMAASDPHIFKRMVLVGPMGIKPEEGEILDFLSLTVRSHLRATVADPENTPEFGAIYGGEMTPAQFEAFEDARTETARLGWEPFMHNPSLPHLLNGVRLPTLIVWGDRDGVVPRGCVDGYRAAIDGARVAEIKGAGHRPEIEDSAAFARVVKDFLKP